MFQKTVRELCLWFYSLVLTNNICVSLSFISSSTHITISFDIFPKIKHIQFVLAECHHNYEVLFVIKEKKMIIVTD